MFTSIRHARVRGIHVTRLQHFHQPHTHDLIRVEQRLARLKEAAINSVRTGVILLGILAFHWKTSIPISRSMLAISVIVGCAVIAVGYARCLAGWWALVLDSITITFLLYGTGGSNSPLLALTLLPMLLGGLMCNSNGVLAGSVAGVAMLLITTSTRQHPISAIVAELALLQVACGLASSMLWRRAEALLTSLSQSLDRVPGAKDEAYQQTDHWQQFYREIAASMTLDQLVRLTTKHAVAIVGANVQVDLNSERATDNTRTHEPNSTHIPIPAEDRSGSIIVDTPPSDLSLAQRNALDQLASVVALRSDALRYTAHLKRQQAAITALWEISGLLRVAINRNEHLRDGLTRLSAALDLNWLALLAPNEYQALAPIISVRGRPGRGAPLMSGAQLRVAAEALRGERPLVRTERDNSLVCLPICQGEYAPLVLAACGEVTDAATQAVLMLFGNLVVERLRSDNHALEAEVIRYRAVAA